MASATPTAQVAITGQYPNQYTRIGQTEIDSGMLSAMRKR
jgi:hypothetical protein